MTKFLEAAKTEETGEKLNVRKNKFEETLTYKTFLFH